MTRRDLPAALSWFDDPQTQRWLGGRAWPAQALRLAEGSVARKALLIEAEGMPAGMIDADMEGYGTVAFALAVAPTLRRRGIATAAVRRLVAGGFFSAARRFAAGVEPGNTASEKLMLAAGFAPAGTLDPDGFQTFRLDRR